MDTTSSDAANESGQDIGRIFEAYKAAVFAKDVDALIVLYGANVRVFDLWAAWSFDGVDAWRAIVAGWFGSLGDDRVVVEVEDMQAIVEHDLAVAHAFIVYRGMSADGSPLHAMRNRLSWVLRREAGAWRVVHEHTSAPVDPQTSKVILQS